MKSTQIKKAGIVLAAMMITTAAQAYDPEFECMKVVTNQGHGPYFPEGAAKINHSAYESYGLTGKVLDTRDNKHYPYTCKIRHGEVVNWRVTKASKHSDKNAAIAAGAGILAIAAIAAAAHDEKHKDHDKGASAFDDMRYLKKQCKRNIRHHIANEDQAVKKIHLDTTHLHNRTLVGEGGVLFKRGGGSDISYECKFDRRGRIYDGHYRFH